LSEESLRSPHWFATQLFDKDDKGITSAQFQCLSTSHKGKGPLPYIIQIHGGPEAQARPWFDPTIQFWVKELGIAGAHPQRARLRRLRQKYLALDNGKLREKLGQRHWRVVGLGKASQPELDNKRAAVYGGSYGGYMVLASSGALRRSNCGQVWTWWVSATL
jgi:hypothetical protein